MKKTLTIIAIIVALSSCSNYYKAITTSGPAKAEGIEALKNQNKYLILRNYNSAWAMSNITVSPDRTAINCNLDTLPSYHKVHLENATTGKFKYRKETAVDNQTVVLNEAHIFVSEDGIRTAGPFRFALDKVQKTEVIEKDIVKTKNRHVVSGVLLAAGGALVIVGIGSLVFANSFISIF